MYGSRHLLDCGGSILSPILGIIASQNYVRATPSYESIQTVTVGSGGQAAVDFTSIPSTYKHLQIRGIGRSTAAQSLAGLRMRVGNSSIDTASNYSEHSLSGDGSSASAGGQANRDLLFAGILTAANDTASVFGVVVLDILDYQNTNKYKTIRSLAGEDRNGSGNLEFHSGNWRSTSTIDVIRFFPSAGNFAQYSQFALYGIKG
jgi:hypothetical protein